MKIIGQIPPILLYFLIGVSSLTESLYSSALPKIAHDLSTKGGIAQLSSSAYFFGFAVGIFSLGRISDIYGRKPVVLFGLLTYAIVSYYISLCADIKMFIALRFLQAYGASVGSVIGQAMARDSYQGWQLSYIYASVSMVMALVPSFGSTLGGYIIQYYTWPTIFRFLASSAIILAIIFVKYLPETNPNIGTARNNRFFDVLKVAISDRTLLSYAFIVGVYNGICFGYYIQAPFIFIENLGMRPSDYGKLFFMLTAASLVGSLSSRYFIKKQVSIFKIMMSGLVLSIIGCSFLFISSLIIDDHYPLSSVVLLIFIPMMIHMLGHSLIVPMMLRNALEDYYKVTGTAGSIFGSLYYVITAAISFLISTLHSDTINNFAIVFICLLSISVVLFYFINKWQSEAKKFDFV